MASAPSSDLTSARVLPPFVVAEVGVVRAAGDDQRVVRAADRAQCNQACISAAVEVEVGDLGQQHAHVALAPEDGAERVGDLARRQRAGRDLVGERLEEVEVAAIDEREIDRRRGELQRGLQAAEAAADDDDPMPLNWRATVRV